MRVVVVAGLVLVAALAGCSDKEADLAGALDDVGDGTGVGLDATLNATVNRAPLANLTADLLAGAAPLNVTFALNGTDEDGGNLTWTLMVGNTTLANGTSLPTNVTHQFVEAGNFSVVFAVTDGGNATTSANVTIAVGAAQAAATGVVEDDYVIFNADGTCDAKGEYSMPLVPLGHAHPRGGTSLWIYEESNGVDGLQVGGSGPGGSEEDAYVDCLNPDALIF